MIRILLPIAAAMTLAAPAAAQRMGYYTAVPVTAPGNASVVTRGTQWFVRGTALVAPEAPAKPAKVCAMVAGKVGALSSFSVQGKAFAPDQLAACNAGASPAAAAAN